MIGVLPHRVIKGVSSLLSEDDIQHFKNNCQDVMSLDEMLNTRFRTDAHFTCYNIEGLPLWPRLNKSILTDIRQDGSDVVLPYFAFDWDNKDHAEWTSESLEAFGNLLATTQDPVISSWSVCYTTAHGARLIYELSKPLPADDAEYNLAWMLHHFHEQGFDGIDDNCKDWTRLFRCPQVIRDTENTWEQGYYTLIRRDNIVLDVNLLGRRSPKTIARKRSKVLDRTAAPAFNELDHLLHTTNKLSGRLCATNYLKRAKKALKDSEYFDMLFNDEPPIWEKGSRNENIMLMLGKVVPVLVSLSATIQQIFALVVQPILALDNDQDWVAHTWNALLDIYNREINKINIQEEILAEKASEEEQILNGMLEGVREWADYILTGQTDDENREIVRKNVLASVRNYYYVLDKNGYYSEFAVSRDQLIPRIRKTYLNSIIDTMKPNSNQELVDITPIAVQNEHSTPVAEVVMRPVGDSGGFIEDMNGAYPKLVLSTFCRNDDLEPEFNPYVNEWLQHLFGDDFEKGCAWIGNALAFEEGLICALSLEGASAAGKKLLAEGLSECLKEPFTATPEDIYNPSSAFLKTPFLIVDEAWPRSIGQSSPADKFKSLTGGDGIIVKEKYQPQIKVLCPIRVVLTANDDGIIRTLMQGKDMGYDNRVAVGERIFHHKVSSKASAYLRSIGGRGFTAREGQRWIRPDSGTGKSDFVVAKHFLWLYRHRDPVDPSQRYLVMGNCAPGAGNGNLTVIDKVLSENNHTPVVSRAIIGMVDSGGVWGRFIRVNKKLTELYITRHGVYKYCREMLEERLSEADVFNGMLNVLATPEPVLIEHNNWYQINTEILSMIATERGIPTTKVRSIYMNSIAETQKGK